jgi:4-hydroxybenzoate polyprenyltransferase
MITFQAIGYEAVKPTATISIQFLLGAVMIGALYMSATCFNDVADEEVDKVNLVNDVSRPLVTTNVTSHQLKILGVVALAIASLAAILISPAYLLVVVSGIVLSLLYSLPPFKISHRGILAVLWLPLSYVVLPFLAGAFIQGSIHSMSLRVLVAMYLCFIGRILLKDFRDYEGDKQFGKLNFLVRHGPKQTCLAAASAWLLGDLFFCAALARNYPVLAIIIQPMVLAVLYGLYLLAYEKRYSRKLLEVLFIGRIGNAVALALLATLTLQAFQYPERQKDLTIVTVGVFMTLTAVGLWRDSALKAELDAKLK